MHTRNTDPDLLQSGLDSMSKLELVEVCLRLGVYRSKRSPRQYAYAVPPEGLRRAIRLHIAAHGPQPLPPAPYRAEELPPLPAPNGGALGGGPGTDAPQGADGTHSKPAPAPAPAPVDEALLKALVDAAVKARMADLTTATRVVLDLPAENGERLEVDAGLQHHLFPLVSNLLNDGMNLWVAGPAGSGKTYSVIQAATLLGYRVFRVPCSEQTPASLFMGFMAASGVYTPGIVWHAIEAQRNGEKSLVVWDEYDRLPAGVGVQANGLLDGSTVTFPNGETLSLADLGVRQCVCGNTFGHPTPDFPTAKKVDRSTLSRFVRVWWDYDEAFETALYPDVADFVEFGHRLRAAAKTLGVTSLCISLRTFDGARKLLAKYGRPVTERLLVWESLPEDDARKLAGALGLQVPAAL